MQVPETLIAYAIHQLVAVGLQESFSCMGESSAVQLSAYADGDVFYDIGLPAAVLRRIRDQCDS